MVNYYLGGDVSKGYSDFVIIDDEKKIVESDFQLDDTYAGHQNLEKVLRLFFQNHPEATLWAAFESTGGYENNWVKFLLDLTKSYPLKVARINPKGINHDSKAALQKSTNDKISARNIAEYQINHPEKILYNQDESTKTLKRTLTILLGKKKSRTAFLNQLETVLYSANPELMIYFKDDTPQWLLKLLKLFPTATSLLKASVEDLVVIPYLSKNKARTIVSQAKQSVASSCDSLTASSIRRLAADILYLDEQINTEIKYLQSKVLIPQITLMETFKGIGSYSAMALFIEMGDIKRFSTAKQLASFFGLHPVYKESGDGSWNYHMSKQGRKKARAVLYMVAFSGLSNNKLIRNLYDHHRAKGKGHKAALGVCMHKICRIIYGMLKNNQPYDEKIDRNNQKKIKRIKKTIKEDSKRRFQQEDPTAPVSSRQTKKRMERERSQREQVTKHEIHVLTPEPL